VQIILANIYVSVCSYRDPLLFQTVASLLSTVSGKHNVVIGIFEQTALQDSLVKTHPELLEKFDCTENIEYQSSIKLGVLYKRIDPEYSDGVGWARNINQHQMDPSMYDFVYQVDSHMIFDKNWDDFLVQNYTAATVLAGHKNVIITNTCKVFWFETEQLIVQPTEPTGGMCKFQHEFPKNCIVTATGVHRPVWPLEEANHLFAGNSFFPVSWVNEVGNDPIMFFDGEEHLLTLRSFLAGYRMYFSTELWSYHYRDTHKYITKQWHEPITSTLRYCRNVQRSQKRLKEYIDSRSDDELKQFADYTGIDYKNRIILDKARI